MTAPMPSELATNPTPPSTAGVVSDEELIRRLRAGDVSAGETLVSRHQMQLMRYLHRLVGSQQQAEELHQQTWLSVLANLDRFQTEQSTADGSGAFKAWLYRIATNKATDLWRSQGRERSMHAGLRLLREEQAPPSDVITETDEQCRRLQQAIQQLPETQRQVLLLRYYSGMKFVEIARTLGCPLNTALGRMHKAVLRLKQLLDEDR